MPLWLISFAVFAAGVDIAGGLADMVGITSSLPVNIPPSLADLRREYSQAGLDLDSSAADPFDQFGAWLDQAVAAGLLEPNAMVLSTVDAEGRPDTRTVLLKGFDRRGPVFFTNYESTKAEQIERQPEVALLLPWYGLERQAKILGRAERISTAESFKYFVSRPLGSRLGAWASPQSKVITSRSLLEMKLEEMKQKFRDGEVPLPSFWGGYRIVPRHWEFWQGRPNRLHDRLTYTPGADGAWVRSRLAP